jgi:hypothetical protein
MSQCKHEESNNLWLTIVGLMTHEFEELALVGHNYPTSAMDVKKNWAFRGMYETIVPLTDRQQELPPTHQYNILYIIRHHMHPEIKVCTGRRTKCSLSSSSELNNKRL